MLTKTEYRAELKCKLLNSLKGSALFIVSANNMMLSPTERKEAMEVIEEFKAYIEAFDIYPELKIDNLSER